MPALRELQRDFSAAMLNHAPSALTPHIRGPHAEARALLYANTVYGTLHKSLEVIYPVLLRLLGQRCFDGLARQFIRQVPSRSGDLHDFGSELPAFLADTPLCSDHPYLPDVAHLEWTVHRVFHARDAAPLDLSRLATVAHEQFNQLCFSLAPASTLLLSTYPIHRIWEANQPQQDGHATLDAEPVRLLVLRRNSAIEMRTLTPGEHAMLSTLSSGRPLAQALEVALAVEPDLDPQAAMLQEVAHGTLTDFYLAAEDTLSGLAQNNDQSGKDDHASPRALPQHQQDI